MSISDTKALPFLGRNSTNSSGADQLRRPLSDNVDVHRQLLRVCHQVEEAEVAWFQLVVIHKLPPASTKDVPPVLDPEYSLPCTVLEGTRASKPHSLALRRKILCCEVSTEFLIA